MVPPLRLGTVRGEAHELGHGVRDSQLVNLRSDALQQELQKKASTYGSKPCYILNGYNIASNRHFLLLGHGWNRCSEKESTQQAGSYILVHSSHNANSSLSLQLYRH